MRKDYVIENCPCKRTHTFPVKEIITEKGAVFHIPELVKKYGCAKPFIVCDKNTYDAAGKSVIELLNNENIPLTSFVFKEDFLEPDEKSVGSLIMHFDHSCDLVIGVGSGVINDLCKILSSVASLPFFIVATAPSMDGYASKTSSMARDGLKVSLNTKCAEVIIGDIDVLKNAPLKMLKAGLGDMLAKYVSICEWRISHLINGEYYCENVARLVRSALDKCTSNAKGLLSRKEEAVKAVFDGLVLCGVAMAYAGVSRPASGVEHYFSHIWDMCALEFGTKNELHGLQCGVGTLLSASLYDHLKKVVPDRNKALSFVENFSYENWCKELRTLFGSSAETMIEQEKNERKYDKTTHPKRLDKIINNWEEIIKIVNEEMPKKEKIEEILSLIEAPKSLEELQIKCDVKTAFKATKDIRYKYIISHLLWDIGMIDEFAELL